MGTQGKRWQIVLGFAVGIFFAAAGIGPGWIAIPAVIFGGVALYKVTA